ncbi:MAG: hypothetical protein ACHQK8_05130, partial [Bacteroidia bacterium]
FLFLLYKQQGNFHGLFRFILASPLFYIALIFLLHSFKNSKLPLLFIMVAILCFLLFLAKVEYGGDRLNFSFYGAWHFIVVGIFLIVRSKIAETKQVIIVSVLVLFNMAWTAYLLNQFLSNAWIFT